MLCVNQWSSNLGKLVLQQISELYRALVWEGFILLAVAKKEDHSVQTSAAGPDADAPQLDLQNKAGASSSAGDSDKLMEVEVVKTPPTPPSSSTAVSVPILAPPIQVSSSIAVENLATAGIVVDMQDESQPAPAGSSQSQSHAQPSISVESLKHLTPLLTITSRVGRSLAELMSLLVRLSTSPLHRTHRRGVGHSLLTHAYSDISKEAVEVCSEITNLLTDSLCWEVPMPHACSSAMESPIRDWLFAG